LGAEYSALTANLKALHRKLNASHVIQIFSSYDFIPTVTFELICRKCVGSVLTIFTSQVVPMEHWPPDQARGFELPGASVALVHNVSCFEFSSIFEAIVEPWAQSPGLLYLPPLLDFSMPFNVMTLNR
jgi:hypothetical protein